MKKSFSMSMYANETDLYKAKAEYFESKYSELLSTLRDEVLKIRVPLKDAIPAVLKVIDRLNKP